VNVSSHGFIFGVLELLKFVVESFVEVLDEFDELGFFFLNELYCFLLVVDGSLNFGHELFNKSGAIFLMSIIIKGVGLGLFHGLAVLVGHFSELRLNLLY
jgi:hypothetical protein